MLASACGLRAFEAHVRELGCHLIKLETAETQAPRFYERHGYHCMHTCSDGRFHLAWHTYEKRLAARAGSPRRLPAPRPGVRVLFSHGEKAPLASFRCAERERHMVRSWIRAAVGGDEVFARLARDMAGSELWSVLMEVVRARARMRSPAEVLAHYARDGFVQPAPLDQRVLVALSAHLLAAAQDFEALELSPVAPLGTCSSVAPTDQHRVLASTPGETVRLTTSQRVAACRLRPNAVAQPS